MLAVLDPTDEGEVEHISQDVVEAHFAALAERCSGPAPPSFEQLSGCWRVYENLLLGLPGEAEAPWYVHRHCQLVGVIVTCAVPRA